MRSTQFLLLASFMLLALRSSAQFVAGEKFLGGSVLFNNSSAPDDASTSDTKQVSILPSIGFLVSERTAVGVRIGYTSIYTRNNSAIFAATTEFETTGHSLSLFTREYFPISETFMFALEGSLGYQKSEIKSKQVSSGVTTESISETGQLELSLRPVFLFFPSPRWGFELSVGNLFYRHITDLDSEAITSQFGMSYGSIGLGVAYYFRK